MLPQIPAGTTDENAWTGPWNEYFPFREGWLVTPQVRTSPTSSKEMLTLANIRPDHPKSTREAVDSGIFFKTERQIIPEMFVEIKSLSAIDQLSVRPDADLQMRRCFTDFYDVTPSIFIGICAFGHIVCKYELNKEDNRIKPAPIQGSLELVVAPGNRWDLDLTTVAGAAQIPNIFQAVKNVRGCV